MELTQDLAKLTIIDRLLMAKQITLQEAFELAKLELTPVSIPFIQTYPYNPADFEVTCISQSDYPMNLTAKC